MMSFKCSNRCEIVFYHLQLRLHAVNTVLMHKTDVKYQYAPQAVCAYVHAFRNPSGCALIGTCALIRTNTVVKLASLCMYIPVKQFQNEPRREKTGLRGF